MGRNSILAVVARLAARDLRNNMGSSLAELQARTGLDLWTVAWGRLRVALESTDRAEVAVMDSWRVGCLQRLLTARLQDHYQCRLDRGEVATGAHRFIGPKLNQMLNSPQAAAPVIHIIFPMFLCISRLNNYVALQEGENGNGNHIQHAN